MRKLCLVGGKILSDSLLWLVGLRLPCGHTLSVILVSRCFCMTGSCWYRLSTLSAKLRTGLQLTRTLSARTRSYWCLDYILHLDRPVRLALARCSAIFKDPLNIGSEGTFDDYQKKKIHQELAPCKQNFRISVDQEALNRQTLSSQCVATRRFS